MRALVVEYSREVSTGDECKGPRTEERQERGILVPSLSLFISNHRDAPEFHRVVRFRIGGALILEPPTGPSPLGKCRAVRKVQVLAKHARAASDWTRIQAQCVAARRHFQSEFTGLAYPGL